MTSEEVSNGDRMAASVWSAADLITPMAIRVAATLRLADRIGDDARTAAALAGTVGADPDVLDRLMRHLVTAGLLEVDRSGRYSLTAYGEVLRERHPFAAAFDLEGAGGRAELSLVELLTTVRTGQACYPVRHGRSLWEDLSASAALSASFDAFMAAKSAAMIPAVVAAADWAGLGHLVDVGGGDASLLIALLARHPTLRGTVVERARPAERARKNLAEAGVSERARVVEGSFFDPLPARAGGYLLCDILHDWDDAGAAAILQRCAEAAGADGSIFVVENFSTIDGHLNTEMDLRVLAWFGGRERDDRELAALAADVGLSVTSVCGVTAGVTITTLRRSAGAPR